MSEISESMDAPKSLRELIDAFIRERLQAKLDKLKPEETDKRDELERSYERSTWLVNLARRASNVRMASHIVKPMNGSIKSIERGAQIVTELRVNQIARMHFEGILSTSNSSAAPYDDDIVGNAALVLADFKLFACRWRKRALLDLVIERDSEFIAALGLGEQADELCSAFTTLGEPGPRPASDTLAKQIYFPVGEGSYHLLAPLFPTSLVQAAQTQMRDDRYGEAAKAAREARNKEQHSAHGYCEYPNMAIQKFGGTKPQNISQLNSERHGENWLLASLPPNWESESVKPPLNCDSIFGTWFGRDKRTRELTRRLREFLETTSHNNIAIRNHRAKLVQEICDEAHDYAAGVQNLVAGWSADPSCELQESEKHWLDPGRVEMDEEFASAHRGDWSTEVGRRFANWLNAQLRSKKFALGEDEQRQWQRDFATEFDMFQNELGGHHD